MLKLIPLPYWICAALLLLAAVAGFGYHKGAQSVKADWDAQKAADLSAAVLIKGRQADVSARIDSSANKTLTETRIIYKAIIKKVPDYVNKTSDAACTIHNGFVRLHDDAASGIISDTASDSDDAPSGVALSSFGETIAENYGTCQETRQQLIGLQGWVNSQRALTIADEQMPVN